MSTYNTDYYAWTYETAAKLRQEKFNEVDMNQIAEELEEMGRSELGELENRLIIILAHLLKWQYQPDRRGNSWRLTIKEQRFRVKRVLRKNPSLKPKLSEAVLEAYIPALMQAARETNLTEETFPAAFEQTNWMIEQVLDEIFYPED
ncbi:hypothetical conserved protein [Candidatus Nitrosoglobus terrae]|uniref:Hypothetical conserved protein n=1 Tax=Candidatus Nitrosoglobus terrae TaxID=1630141 RepID=A0A1Q2SLC6_9GAMM|nr:DUF29 domain-containing protein [Candidatus Nitrosoglobus terrae]BAW79955.1 hypothetical conserved protein [Candidatus Nitrosoglobus terrae]